jgi:hypothetical protein
MEMITIPSNEFVAIGYNNDEQAIYVQDNQNLTHIFENKSKEEFDQFKNSKQHDYFYLYVLQKHQHKIDACPK